MLLGLSSLKDVLCWLEQCCWPGTSRCCPFGFAPAAKAALPSPFPGDNLHATTNYGSGKKAWPPGPNSRQPWRVILMPRLPKATVGPSLYPIRFPSSLFQRCQSQGSFLIKSHLEGSTPKVGEERNTEAVCADRCVLSRARRTWGNAQHGLV